MSTIESRSVAWVILGTSARPQTTLASALSASQPAAPKWSGWPWVISTWATSPKVRPWAASVASSSSVLSAHIIPGSTTVTGSSSRT